MRNSLFQAVPALLALAGLGSIFVERVRAVGTAPPPGMVLWLPLDESAGPVAANLIPGTPSGAWNGTPAVMPEYVARGLGFDGTGSAWVDVPNYPALEIGTNDFTIDCWMRFDGPTAAGDYILINKYSGVNAGQQWGYGLALSNGRLHCRFADGTIGAYSDGAHVFVPDPSTWHHVAVTVQRGLASGGRFYVNGVPTGGFNPTAHPGSVANGQLLRLCKAINAPTPAPWPGCLDEVEVFTRALSSAEIAALFAAGRDGKFKPSCAPATGHAFCFNTGMSGSGAALPAGAVDPLFQAASPNFLNYPNAYVQGLPAYPLWNSTPSISQWITPDANALNFLPSSTYTFRATFLLPNPAGSHVVGRWLAGAVGRIIVNGTPQPAWNTPGPPVFGATTWTPVNITAGLVAGLNTLDFEVDAWSVTPCGMRAELCVTSPPPAHCITLACPMDTEVWTCGTNAMAAYTATAANTCGGAVNLLCQPPAGTSLPPGTNRVQCTAYDGLGACAACAFNIVVWRDTNAPAVLCPGDITEFACGGAASGPVSFRVNARDDSGVTSTVVCTNQSGQAVTSGQAFPLGTTAVTCFATDHCGHTGQCRFLVTVLNPLLPFAFSAGVHNNGAGALAGGTPEPATVGACLNAAYPVPVLPWKHLDVTDTDRWFGHEFSWLPAGLTRARLDAVMSPAPFNFNAAPVTTNDILQLHHLTCAPGGGFAWGQQIWQLPGAGGSWNVSLFPNWHTLSLDLTNLPPGFPGNTNNLLPLLNAPGHQRLEVLVQDDTTVDYLRLSGTFCPGGPFLAGVPAVLGPGVTLVHVPGAAAALRLAAPSTGEVTLATIPLNGADGLALSGAGWGTDDLDQDGATDPVDAFSVVRVNYVCARGVCNGITVKWTPDGRAEVAVDAFADYGTNVTLQVRLRDRAGNETASPLVANSFPAQFQFEEILLSAMPTTNVTCPDLWERPRLTLFDPTHSTGTNEILLFSVSAACGRLLTNTAGGAAFAAMDYFLELGDIEGETRSRTQVTSVVLSSRGTRGTTVAELRPVLLERTGSPSAGQRGRRQHMPLKLLKEIDKHTPLGVFLPHPGGWNATGLGSNSTMSLGLGALTPSLELRVAPEPVLPELVIAGDDMQSILTHVRGQVGGVEQVLDTCTARLVTNSVAGGAGVRLEPDFSAVGAASIRVQVYDAAHLLLRDLAGNTTDAGIAGAWPSRWGQLGGQARGRIFRWDSPTRYTLGIQTFSNVAVVLILAGEEPAAPAIEGVSGMDFITTGISLLDFGALQTDLGAQRVVSLVPDGAGFRVTWSPPGGRLQASTNLVNWLSLTNLSGHSITTAPSGQSFYRITE